MNINGLDQSSVITPFFMNSSISELNSQNLDEKGSINLYNNQELVLWNTSGTQYVSAAKFGNYSRDIFSYPALMFYNTNDIEQFPLLDIGIQPSGTGKSAVIAFKKHEDLELTTYATIELTPSNELRTNAEKIINNYTSGSASFSQINEVDDGIYTQTIKEGNETIATFGTITNQEILNNLPQPRLQTNFEPMTAIFIGVAIAVPVAILLVGIGLAIFSLVTSDNSEEVKNYYEINDYNETTQQYENSVFVIPDQIQFNGPQFNIQRNATMLTEFKPTGMTLNTSIVSESEGTKYITLDADGNLGTLILTQAIIQVKNNQIQLVKSKNVKSVSKLGSKICVELESKTSKKIKVKVLSTKNGFLKPILSFNGTKIEFELWSQNSIFDLSTADLVLSLN